MAALPPGFQDAASQNREESGVRTSLGKDNPFGGSARLKFCVGKDEALSLGVFSCAGIEGKCKTAEFGGVVYTEHVLPAAA